MINWLILEGDARAVLAEMPAASVQTCITSPPYYGLRSYGTAGQVWGGDPACAHEWATVARPGITGGDGTSSGLRKDGRPEAGRIAAARVTVARQVTGPTITSATCARCGAWQGELGNEPAVEQYVAHLVDVFRAVRRVLRPDGTLWLNLGDSYSHDRKWGGRSGGKNYTSAAGGYRRAKQVTGLGEGQLLLMPARVALALQADGWILRSEIIWHKLNPMPESVQDRPTKAHEQLYLLTVGRRYYYDAAAIAEPAIKGAAGSTFTQGKTGINGQGRVSQLPRGESDTRNKRDVWSLASDPYPDAHFATFPPALIEPCILAGSRPGDTVLDPFSGAGTTVMEALRHERRGIGIDLNPTYVQLSRARIVGDAPLFNTCEVAS